MPENTWNTVILVLFIGLWVLAMVGVAVKLFKNRLASIKTVKAEVIGKNKIEGFSKYAGNGKREKYVVVFQAEGKKLSFYVSEFTYRGYKPGETGTLKYKGDKIIDFS